MYVKLINNCQSLDNFLAPGVTSLPAELKCEYKRIKTRHSTNVKKTFYKKWSHLACCKFPKITSGAYICRTFFCELAYIRRGLIFWGLIIGGKFVISYGYIHILYRSLNGAIKLIFWEAYFRNALFCEDYRITSNFDISTLLQHIILVSKIMSIFLD